MPLKHIPNILSFSRILIAPVFVVCMFKNLFIYKIISFLIFFIGSVSDFLDGYIARKFHFKSNFGKYLDPFADKILILSALLTLNLFYPSIVKFWMIIAIISRDIVVTLFRFLLMNNNIIMKTSKYAKAKTLILIILVHLILILHLFDLSSFSVFSSSIYYLMIFSTVYTVLTGFHYIKINFNYFQ